MTYELCLEYGTYPLSRVDAYWGEDQNPQHSFKKIDCFAIN